MLILCLGLILRWRHVSIWRIQADAARVQPLISRANPPSAVARHSSTASSGRCTLSSLAARSVRTGSETGSCVVGGSTSTGCAGLRFSPLLGAWPAGAAECRTDAVDGDAGGVAAGLAGVAGAGVGLDLAVAGVAAKGSIGGDAGFEGLCAFGRLCCAGGATLSLPSRDIDDAVEEDDLGRDDDCGWLGEADALDSGWLSTNGEREHMGVDCAVGREAAVASRAVCTSTACGERLVCGGSGACGAECSSRRRSSVPKRGCRRMIHLSGASMIQSGTTSAPLTTSPACAKAATGASTRGRVRTDTRGA
mmetsp:Transcript_37900/g.79646  ORF Transcript_37900/g.79646 Transcript_37900/m.79646 type:complete len:307 (+) Transcript_37900:234-1154(+)